MGDAYHLSAHIFCMVVNPHIHLFYILLSPKHRIRQRRVDINRSSLSALLPCLAHGASTSL